MSNILKFFIVVKTEKKKASLMVEKCIKDQSPDDISLYHQGRLDAFSFLDEKLTLLLNAEAGTNGQEGTKNDGNAV